MIRERVSMLRDTCIACLVCGYVRLTHLLNVYRYKFGR